jgi:hypothetical protein
MSSKDSEMAHLKISKQLEGGKIWDSVIKSDPEADLLLEPFDEYLTERTAKLEFRNEHVFIELDKIINEDTFHSFYRNAVFSNENPLKITEIVAKAKEFDPSKYNLMKGYLSQDIGERKRLLALADEMHENRNYLSDSDNSILLSISEQSKTILKNRGLI